MHISDEHTWSLLRNRFVVQVDRSHGWQSFRVISTKDRIHKIIDSFTKALDSSLSSFIVRVIIAAP
jgi:hypothetical protein